jgi:hypothetical protein
MDQWEYMPLFIEANAREKETKTYLKEKMPDQKRFPKYMAQAMMPELNELGAQGWELVHMEPVADVGKKGDVLVSGSFRWSNTYFCVFKRRKTVATVMPLNAAGQPAFPAQPAQPPAHTLPQQPQPQQVAPQPEPVEAPK